MELSMSLCHEDENGSKTQPINQTPPRATQGSSASASEDVIAMCSPTRLQDLKSELQKLKETFEDELPLCEIPASIHHDPSSPIPKKLISQYVEGQKLPLTELNGRLSKALYGKSGVLAHDLKVQILGIAVRKYYGPREGMSKEELDPFEDVNGMPFWIWETKSMSYLEENLKQKASLQRQKHKQLRNRLLAVFAVVKLLEDESKSRMKNFQTKLRAAMEKVYRTSTLHEIIDGNESGEEFEVSKRVRKRVKRETDVACVLSSQKEKSQETKLATVSGFGSIKSLRKAQTIFKNFFETPEKKVSQMSEFKLAGQMSISCPEEKRLKYKEGDVELMDQVLNQKWTQQGVSRNFTETCRRLSLDRDRFKSVIYGAPATWARRPDFEFCFEKESEKLFGIEWSKEEVSIVRKKYLWFISDSQCPPFFGPFLQVDGVSSRNPCKRIDGLDYEEMFDEGWEQEPEGESLSGEEEDEEEKQWLSEDDDLFIVEDGYLSEDEGLGGEMDLEDNDSISSENDTVGSKELVDRVKSEPKVDFIVKRAVRSGQLSVISTLKMDQVSGDVSLLPSLQGFRIGKGTISTKNKN